MVQSQANYRSYNAMLLWIAGLLIQNSSSADARTQQNLMAQRTNSYFINGVSNWG
jgi:hypothetical protein